MNVQRLRGFLAFASLAIAMAGVRVSHPSAFAEELQTAGHRHIAKSRSTASGNGYRVVQGPPGPHPAHRDDNASSRLRRILAQSVRKNWYVAPYGLRSNPGSKEAPWDIESALTNRTRVKAGDTLWLRGGTYRHPNRSAGSKGYVINLQGKPDKPVTVSAYRSERVTIDGGLHTEGFPYDENRPEHLIIRDLEVIVAENLSQPRVSSHTGSAPPADLKRPWGGIEIGDGVDIKLINNVIHGNMQGVSLWARVGGDSELYGNLIYDNGWMAPDRGHGHGVYLQNEPTSYKYLRNNVVFGQYSMNVHAYGSSSASIENVVIDQNIFYSAADRPNNRVLVGGLNRKSNRGFRIARNVHFHSNLQVGYGGRSVHDAEVTGNTIVLAKMEATNLSRGVLHDNFVWEELYLSNHGGWTGRLKPVPNDNVDVPAKPLVFLHPNSYASNRAHVAILCFGGQRELEIPVSEFLNPGDEFELRRPDNFYGSAVYRGTCKGPLASVPISGIFTVYVMLVTERA